MEQNSVNSDKERDVSTEEYVNSDADKTHEWKSFTTDGETHNFA